MALVHSDGSGDYDTSFGNVDRSAFALGPKAKAKVVNQDLAPRRYLTGEIISKLDELIRGVEEHWAALADPGEIRYDLKAVRAEVRDREPDTTAITKKLNHAVTRLAPVAALTELAASIAELVGHLH